MRIDDLRTFAAVARLQSVARAARDLGIARTTLTRKLDRLEATIGTALLIRTERGVRLTGAGAALLDSSQLLLDEAEGILSTPQPDTALHTRGPRTQQDFSLYVEPTVPPEVVVRLLASLPEGAHPSFSEQGAWRLTLGGPDDSLLLEDLEVCAQMADVWAQVAKEGRDSTHLAGVWTPAAELANALQPLTEHPPLLFDRLDVLRHWGTVTGAPAVMPRTPGFAQVPTTAPITPGLQVRLSGPDETLAQEIVSRFRAEDPRLRG
jgi:DNA-binding transcriptional LysR family regulator